MSIASTGSMSQIHYTIDKCSKIRVKLTIQSSAVITRSNLSRYKCSLIYHDITYHNAVTVAENAWDIRITTDTPYLALTGELWGVYRENLGENWPRYNGTALYVISDWGNCLAMNRQEAINWSNADQDVWRHIASLGLNEFICSKHHCFK